MRKLYKFYTWMLVVTSFLSSNQYAKHEKYTVRNSGATSMTDKELEQIDAHRLQSYVTIANKLLCLSDAQIAELVSNHKEWSSGYG